MLPPIIPPSSPRHPVPPGACDAHAHVLGPYSSFPLAEDRTYESPELPVTEYLRMLDAIGFTRGVVVTASAYGTDNGAMLQALRASPSRLRGVAVVDARTPSAALVAMNSVGVRGARFARFPGFSGTVDLDELDRIAPQLREMGWHAQIWTLLGRFVPIANRLLGHRLPLVLDHMAFIDVRKGIADAGFQAVLRLLGEGRVWVKLIAYRLSRGVADYEDVRPFHDALVAANPDQLVWGSDWPHVHMTSGMPDDGYLVDLFEGWVPDALRRQKILVDNPRRLYGF